MSLAHTRPHPSEVSYVDQASEATPNLRRSFVGCAAAGNAGPQSEPPYPAADPDVIAVTATDSRNGLFKAANRGAYVAVAAARVDILALAPGGSYQITTGTSVAAAHVSGVSALLFAARAVAQAKGHSRHFDGDGKPLAGAVQQYPIPGRA